MKQKTVINVILGVCAIGLLYITYRSIMDDIDFDDEVAAREQVVKTRLLQIRDAEEAYKMQSPDGAYCADWNTLIDFIKNGKLPVVIKEGVLSDAQMEKGLTEASAARIVNSGNQAAIAANGLQGFRRDTTWVSLKDSLYKGLNLNYDSLRYIPFAESDTFELIAIPNTTKSGAIIQVMECNAPFSSYLKGMGKRGKRMIYNRTQDAEEKGVYPGLKIGEAGDGWNNNAGNWE